MRIALTNGLSRRGVAADLEVAFRPGTSGCRNIGGVLVSAAQADLARENERLRFENRIIGRRGKY